MRLKRLELQGFKSFLDRTVLSFEPGVTGVVGPNGCGKSNIVDAILWVMGEQSPKHLRGENMTDVIFNGSDSRQPTSMAEVSLVLDKQGVALAPQFRAFDTSDEIAITRRIYRDGGGEFLLNKVPCRLKDIHELFMDTGVGRRAYSIIEQGQIDRMINVKPEERRAIFEEVAGITKYKAKRKEAERKLEQTRGNLTRLDDIIVELEKQLRSLKIQASRAKKYRELKGELETIDLHLMGRDYAKIRRELALLEEEKTRLSEDRGRWDAAVAARDAELTDLETKRIEEEKRYQELSQKERSLGLEAQKISGDKELAAERRRNLDRSRVQADQEREELGQRSEELRAEFDEKQTAQAQFGDRLAELDRTLAHKEQELFAQQEARRAANRRREELLRERSRAEAERAQLEAKLEGLRARQDELADKEQRILVELDEMRAEATRLAESLTQAEARAQAAKDAIAAGEAAVADAGREGTSLSANLSRVEEELFALREQFHGARSRLESLRELQENLEGFPPSAKELFGRAAEAGISAKLLGDVVRPPRDLEEPVELLLGDLVGAVVVKTASDARKLVELARDEGFERVRVVATDDLVLSDRKPVDREDSLWRRVQAEAGYEAVLRWAFGNVALASGDEDLFRVRDSETGVDWLSAEGRLVARGDRSLEGGKAAQRAGVFARKREMDELADQCRALEASVDEKAAEQKATLAALEEQERRRDELKARLSTLHVESVEARKDRERVAHERSRHDSESQRKEDERERLEAQREELQSASTASQTRFDELQSNTEEFETSITAAEAEVHAAEQAAEALAASCGELRVEKGTQAERQTALEDAIIRLEADLASAARRLTQIDAQEEQRRDEEESLEATTRDLANREEHVKSELAETQVAVSKTQQVFYEVCERIQTLRDELTEWQKSRDFAQQRAAEVALRIEQERGRSENLRALAEERYQRELVALDEGEELTPEQLPIFLEQLSLDWATVTLEDRNVLLAEHAKSLREKVSRYGEVNLAAIQEHDEVQKRYDFLSAQKKDLESSIQLLEEAIVRIDETSQYRFKETFDAVQKKFGEIFPILFNGGKGELTLTNPDVPLESGVDILVQPPGKRLQSITLLSGGEKALTAVSLVLSIFARKPSPFCLLDEVDAPLDDANVSRFNTVIRKMAEKTQFIVITHNKKTMEIAEALYGVTMERAGVSKMASVRLDA